jgi:CubicO group peptidase (beta-lactamase class C family)
MHRSRSLLLATLALMPLLFAPPAGAHSEGSAVSSPPPELRGAIDAVAATLSAGDPDAWERLARERFTPDLFARRTAEQRRQFIARFRQELGTAAVTTVRSTAPWAADAEFRGSAPGDTGTLHVELEAAAPHRIRELQILVERGGEEGAGARILLPPLPELRGVVEPRRLAGLLDPYLGELAGHDALSGVVLVAHAGTALYERAFGLADRERRTPNTVDTRFNIASIGKLITSVAVGQLLEEGRLALDDPIAKHLPAYPNAAAARQVTIRQLLDHRAGIPDIFDVVKAGDPPPASNHDWFLRVAPRPLEFAPGSQRRYCNGCYVVLGEIVAAASGMPYEDYVASHVFAPAGMTGAAFLETSGREERKAQGYTRTPGGLEPVTMGAGGRGCAAGGVFATAADLLAFDNAVRGFRLLNRQWTGWLLGGGEGGEAAGERAAAGLAVGGGAPGTNSLLASDGTWTVVVLTNRDPRLGAELGDALAKALQR